MNAVQVDFYILSEPSVDPLLIVCRIAEKAWRNRYSVQVNTRDEDGARRLDDLMWTYRQDSFLPHEVALTPSAEPEAAAASTPPVRIALCDTGVADSTMLINAAGAGSRLPELLRDAQTNKLERIAEVVAADDDEKRGARERYRLYREYEFALQTHDV